MLTQGFPQTRVRAQLTACPYPGTAGAPIASRGKPTRHRNRSQGAWVCQAPNPAGIRRPQAARPVGPGGSRAHTQPGHQHQSIRAPARRLEPLQNPPRLRPRGLMVWSWIPQGGQDLGRAGMDTWLNQTDGFPVPPGEAAGPPCRSIRRPRLQRGRPPSGPHLSTPKGNRIPPTGAAEKTGRPTTPCQAPWHRPLPPGEG